MLLYYSDIDIPPVGCPKLTKSSVDALCDTQTL
eukprot:COSAG01_NODE_20116_length_969_cov_10.208046_3_plen_32_part_01